MAMPTAPTRRSVMRSCFLTAMAATTMTGYV